MPTMTSNWPTACEYHSSNSERDINFDVYQRCVVFALDLIKRRLRFPRRTQKQTIDCGETVTVFIRTIEESIHFDCIRSPL
jgi:hypothetical protein